jgi:hypothetical protein
MFEWETCVNCYHYLSCTHPLVCTVAVLRTAVRRRRPATGRPNRSPGYTCLKKGPKTTSTHLDVGQVWCQLMNGLARLRIDHVHLILASNEYPLLSTVVHKEVTVLMIVFEFDFTLGFQRFRVHVDCVVTAGHHVDSVVFQIHCHALCRVVDCDLVQCITSRTRGTV